jgi:hypothetical protein
MVWRAKRGRDLRPARMPIFAATAAPDLEHELRWIAHSAPVSVCGSAFATMPTMRRSAPMNTMSSGMSVFFIQKVCTKGRLKTKSMPGRASSCLRNMRPTSCSAGVRASSHAKRSAPGRVDEHRAGRGLVAAPSPACRRRAPLTGVLAGGAGRAPPDAAASASTKRRDVESTAPRYHQTVTARYGLPPPAGGCS